MPSSPKLTGALLVVAMTVGYMVTDQLIVARFSARDAASTEEMCCGPTAENAAKCNANLELEAERGSR